MVFVKDKYKKYLQTYCGAQNYLDFKRILYSDNDPLVSFLNREIMPICMQNKNKSVEVCDIGGGDGYRILSILSYLYEKRKIEYRLDFIEQSKIYCKMFEKRLCDHPNINNVNIINNSFERVGCNKQYDIILLIHSIYSLNEGELFCKMLRMAKDNANIIIVCNSEDSVLAKVKRKIDIDYYDNRLEVGEIKNMMDVLDIRYSISKYITKWSIKKNMLDIQLYTIFQWLTLGDYEKYTEIQRKRIKDAVMEYSAFNKNKYVFKENEEIIIINAKDVLETRELNGNTLCSTSYN